MNLHLLSLLAGVGLDLCLGDPHGLPHPVRLVGALIFRMERWLRRWFPATEQGELAAGVCLSVFVPSLCGGVAAVILWAAAQETSGWLLFLAETILTYYLLAARSLRDESMAVYHALRQGDLEKARTAVSMIVGRDTDCLDGTGITKAAVETVAENASDGVIAPLFYLALGGPVLGWIYKAVNTMDSMVGYQNETYLYFGRAAARLDDVLNWIPSRLSALLMVGAAWLLSMDGAGAYRIWRRDRRNHKSPNSAQTEAVCAGALGVQLAGDAWYFGKLCRKPWIGDAVRPVETEDIRRANHLMLTAAFLALLPACLVRMIG
ncbi:MAG: cobalamin biosynthesis protein CobD [Clostridium sp.]|nr:cobalamin biosynthesis protein CobD [Clostridium sp.]